MNFKASDNLNAEIRENLTPDVAKKIFDDTSRFNEELHKFVIKNMGEKNIPIEFVIGSLEKLKFNLMDICKFQQLSAINNFYKNINFSPF